MSIPASVRSASPERCAEVPLPVEAKCSVPGRAFASSTSARTERTGRSGCTTSTIGCAASRATGEKSVTGLYGKLRYSVTLMAWVWLPAKPSV